MGKASSNKKVARAASTGGGRTARGSRPWGWYGSMILVAILGSLVIVTSRNERQAASNPLKSEKPRPPSLPGQSKKFAGDHWHAAYGISICGEFVPAINSEKDPRGIHTHNDGVIHIHPFTKASSGRNATFGVFAEAVGLKVSDTSVQVPGGKRYENGDACPGGKKGKLRVRLNKDERPGDPKKIRMRDRDLIVIAFAPAGTDIPKSPPSAGQLDKLNDVPGSPGLTVPSSVPEGTGSTLPGAPGAATPPGPGAPGAATPPAPGATTPGAPPTAAPTPSSSP